eukprot:SAG31_NODE_4197_length_3483_cov_1.755319_4_plen_91_part_00
MACSLEKRSAVAWGERVQNIRRRGKCNTRTESFVVISAGEISLKVETPLFCSTKQKEHNDSQTQDAKTPAETTVVRSLDVVGNSRKKRNT